MHREKVLPSELMNTAGCIKDADGLLVKHTCAKIKFNTFFVKC